MIALNISGASAPKGKTAAHSAEECATELHNPGFVEVIDADERHRVQDTAPGTLTPHSTSGKLRLAGRNDFLADDANNAVAVIRTAAGETQMASPFELEVRKIRHETKAHDSPPQIAAQPNDDAKLVAPADIDASPIGLDETRGRIAEEVSGESAVDLSGELIGTGEVAPDPWAQDLSVRIDAAPRGYQAERPESNVAPQTKLAVRVDDGALGPARSESSLLDRDAATKPKAAVQPRQATRSDPGAAVLTSPPAISIPHASDEEHVAPLGAEKLLAADLDLNGSTTPTVRSSAGPNRGGVPFATANNPETYSWDSGVSRKSEQVAQSGLVRPDQTPRTGASAASNPGPINSGPAAPPHPEKRDLADQAASALGFANRSGPTPHGSESLEVQAQDPLQFEHLLSRAVDRHQTGRSKTAGIAAPDQVRRDVDNPTTQLDGGGGRITAPLERPANGNREMPPSDAPVVPASIAVASYRLSWHPAIRESHHHLVANGSLVQKRSGDEIAAVRSVPTESTEVPDLSDKASLKTAIATSFEVASDRKGPMAFPPTPTGSAPPTARGSDVLAPALGAPGPTSAAASVAANVAFAKEGEAAANLAQVRAATEQGAATDVKFPARLSVIDHARAQQPSALRAYASAEWRPAPSVKPMVTTASADRTQDGMVFAPVTSQNSASSFPFASPQGAEAGTGSLEFDLPRSRPADVPSRPGTVPQSADRTGLPPTAVAGGGLRDRAASLMAGDQMSRPRARASGMPTNSDQTARPVALASGPSGANSVAASASIVKPEPETGLRVRPEAPDLSRAKIGKLYPDHHRGPDESAARTQGFGRALLDGPGTGERAAVDLSGARHAGVKGPAGHADSLPAEYGPALFHTNAASGFGPADRPERTKARPADTEVASGALASPSTPTAPAHPGTRSEKSGAVGAQAVSARKNPLASKPMPDVAMPNLVPGKPDFERAVTAASDPTPAAGPHHAYGLPGHLPATLAKAASAASADDRVELLLDPVELGKVRFELTSTADRVQVNVSVERPETLDLLRRNIDVLRAEFRDAGFDASTLSFSQWGKGGDSAPQSPFAATPLSNDPAAEDPASPPPLLARNTSRHGLDLRL